MHDTQALTWPGHLVVRDLGRMAYAPALLLQREVHQRVLDRSSPQTLLLVEHEPVITLSKRRGVGRNLLASGQELADLGIEVADTDRGGDITYHGPGQLVAYPFVRLSPLGLNVGRYMRWLEQVVIDTVATFGVTALRIEGCVGVWVDASDCNGATTTHRMNKLCAFGVRVRKNVTMHGLALNVSTDLRHYRSIVPCGLVDKGVTTLQQLLGVDCPGMESVKVELAGQMQHHLAALADAGRASSAM